MKHPPLDRLRSVFEKYPAVRAVYLFGSAALGRAQPESDIDLAVVAEGKGVGSEKLDMLADLADAGFCDVDLVFLPEDDIVLRFEAVRHNRIVYQRPDFDSGTLYSLTLRMYFDFLPYLRVQREAYKHRILHGEP